jgi:hypothetical protein
MHRIAGTVLVLLLARPALTDEDKSHDKVKAATPAEQYKALLKEFEDARKGFRKAYQEAKSAEERRKVLDSEAQLDQYAPRFLDLAKKYPTDPAALDALIWVATIGSAGDTTETHQVQNEALLILRRDHINSDKLGPMCSLLRIRSDRGVEEFLRAVLDKNPDRDIQGQACFALATQLKNRADKDSRLAKEAEKFCERALDHYADVSLPFQRGTVGDRAKGMLFEIRFLSIGKAAPDIEGEDQDGKSFKLSDYRGKVVLLDFWSQY